MKKFLLTAVFAVLALTVSAQYSAPFTTYTPVYVDGYGNSSQQYSNPFANSEPIFTPPSQPQQQQSQILSTRGYYFKNNQWNSVLVKVQVIGDYVYVVGVKKQTGWSSDKLKASSTQLMPQNIRESFDYYVSDYSYGRIYF